MGAILEGTSRVFGIDAPMTNSPKVKIHFGGITPEDAAIMKVTIRRIDGESTLTKILTPEDPDMVITEDDLMG